MKKRELSVNSPADFYLMSKEDLISIKSAIMVYFGINDEMSYDPKDLTCAWIYIKTEKTLRELDNFIKERFFEELNDDLKQDYRGSDMKIDADVMLGRLEFHPLSELMYIPEFEEIPEPDDDRACIRALERIFH